MSLIALWLIGSGAFAKPPLEVTVTDSKVIALVLDCGGHTMKAVVKDGKATFAETPRGSCKVDFIRDSGIIDQPGEWTCGLDGCVQDDLHHLVVTDEDGRLNVVTTGLDPAASLELNCPSGYRERSEIRENTAVFNNVPNEGCSLLFKGGVPAKYSPLNWGTYYCSLTSTTAVCTRKKAS